nr:MAG TPA: adenine-specific methyltransferase [Caudoviricetes sp.]
MNPTYEHHRPYDGCDLYRGDALDVLPLLAQEGITADMVLSDPPYGTTHCRWDAVIDIPGMWNAVQGISRPDTPVLLFCQHPFTSLLGSSNLRRLRYAWVWEKTQATGFLNARRMPMKAHEDILVFYDRLPKYHPIKTDGHNIREIWGLILDDVIQMDAPLLIFDEADKLTEPVFHYFISMYNKLEDKSGIVFLSTDYIKKRINLGLRHQKPGYKEFFSRMGRKYFELEETTAGDVYSICVANGVQDKKKIEEVIRDAEPCDFDLRRVKKAIHRAKRMGE